MEPSKKEQLRMFNLHKTLNVSQKIGSGKLKYKTKDFKGKGSSKKQD